MMVAVQDLTIYDQFVSPVTPDETFSKYVQAHKIHLERGGPENTHSKRTNNISSLPVEPAGDSRRLSIGEAITSLQLLLLCLFGLLL